MRATDLLHSRGGGDRDVLALGLNGSWMSARAIWDLLEALATANEESEVFRALEIYVSPYALGVAEPGRRWGCERLFEKEEAASWLARELVSRAGEIREAIGPTPESDEEACEMLDGRLRFVELLARWVEGLGGGAVKIAQQIRGIGEGCSAEETWRTLVDLEKPVPARPITFAAVGLWLAGHPAEFVLGEEANREGVDAPAIAMGVVEHVADLCAGGITIVGERAEAKLVDADQRIVAALPPMMEVGVLEFLASRTSVLGSLTLQRLIRWEIGEGHRRAMEGVADARCLRVEGGWSGLASAVGARSKGAAQEVQAVVLYQAHAIFAWPDGSRGNLVTYTVRPAVGQRPSEVALVLGDVLLPSYATTLKSLPGSISQSSREARRLVPVTALPPFSGRNADRGPQAAMSLRVVVELRKRAREIVAEGGALLTGEVLDDCARAARLPIGTLSTVIECWITGNDEAPPFLDRVDRDRYHLGRTHVAARACLEEAGEKERRGSARGKLSAAKRRSGKHLRRKAS